jgi:hypothetical protein
VIPYRVSVVPEFLLSQEVPSEEVRMVPEKPTVTNNSVVVELSVLVVLDELLDELLDEVQDMEMKLKRNIEIMMRVCFTWFPKSGLGEPYLYHDSGFFYKNVGILLGGV